METEYRANKVLLLGSGALRVAQAGEFDYAGSQAIKALKEEGVKTLLINPNIATVQTDAEMADILYLYPITSEWVTRVIEKERPDGIMIGFGGQTALNVGLELHKMGVLEKHGVRLLGSSFETISKSEDRALFKSAMESIGIQTARGFSFESLEALMGSRTLPTFPWMLRTGFSLGGFGSRVIREKNELKHKLSALLRNASSLLVEEFLEGWKEVEYEVVRDEEGNAVSVCNMENFDPLGIHTGDSIVVAPSQTLSDFEHQNLRNAALQIADHLKIIGECNVQFALNPKNGEFRVIEVNPRLSRSSALASKVTGYPLAYVAAKIALGKSLHQIRIGRDGSLSAFFEPALDYIAVKMPRWDFRKFRAVDRVLSTEMKSVGEVMAIGRSFAEALQKAIRMVNIGAEGLSDHPFSIANPCEEIKKPTDRRLFALYEFLKQSGQVEEAHKITGIDPWFLWKLEEIVQLEKELIAEFSTGAIVTSKLREAKKAGFSDRTLAKLKGTDEETIRNLRKSLKILPVFKQIDSVAGECVLESNHFYATYHGTFSDCSPLKEEGVIVLGAGPYAVGSSVEFDWCAVNLVKALKTHKRRAIVVNSNPNTVSTDQDVADRLYFEELSLERVLDITDHEGCLDGVVCAGGQIANRLAKPLHSAGMHILGSPAESIDQAECRQNFSLLLENLKISQPPYRFVSNLDEARLSAVELGFPILVRRSYVLSGEDFKLLYNSSELEAYLENQSKPHFASPVVMTKFFADAEEFELDGAAFHGDILAYAFLEHVEQAGKHSGDATLIYPPQRLGQGILKRALEISKSISQALAITGPFNIQFILKDDLLMVLECNLRASRSLPFISKASEIDFMELSAKALLGLREVVSPQPCDKKYIAVKSAQFSYDRLRGADPVSWVEMNSTGEAACFGKDFCEVFYLSWLSTHPHPKEKKIFISMDDSKAVLLQKELEALSQRNWEIYAPPKTRSFLSSKGIRCFPCDLNRRNLTFSSSLSNGLRKYAIVISIPSSYQQEELDREYILRRAAIDAGTSVISNAREALYLLKSLCEIEKSSLEVKSLQEFRLFY